MSGFWGNSYGEKSIALPLSLSPSIRVFWGEGRQTKRVIAQNLN